jgi:hypothetical protein
MKARMLLTLPLIFLLIGCAAPRSRGFSLDDYKTDKAAKAKLESMFPIGTNVNEFTKFMKELGIECDFGKDVQTGQEATECCASTEFRLIQVIKWGLFADFDSQRRITKIEVGRHYNAL